LGWKTEELGLRLFESMQSSRDEPVESKVLAEA